MQKWNRVLYDVTISLVYPSVLGVLIFFFFEAFISVSVLPLLNNIAVNIDPNTIRQPTADYNFFAEFGFSSAGGLTVFLLFTLLTFTHHSIDYLYSKYLERQYTILDFVLDTFISLLLAAAYIVLSQNASIDFQHIRISLVTFWFAFFITYLIFIIWDQQSYRTCKDRDEAFAKFYRSMIFGLELPSAALFLMLAITPIFILQPSWFSRIYIIISIIVLTVVTILFGKKTGELEVLSMAMDEKSSTHTQDVPKTTKTSVAIKQMDSVDIDVCSRLFADAYQKVYSEPWTVESSGCRLKEIYAQSPNYCLVLTVDTIIVGFMMGRTFQWFDGLRVWIEEVVIDEHYRGKGYGKMLMRVFYEKARSEDIKGFSLISRTESKAYAIYLSQGYRPSDWVHLEADIDTF